MARPGCGGISLARLAEAIQLIRELWKGDTVSFRGKYYRTRRAKLYTRPEEPIPIYISSMVPESAYFAGRHGDGLFTVGGEEAPVYRQMMENFEAGARASGRDPISMPRIVEVRVAFTKDEAGAIESIKRYWASSFLPAMFNHRIADPVEAQRNGAVVGAEGIRRRVLISADSEQHVRNAEKLLELGFDRIYFFSAGPDQRAFVETYGREVLPRLRQGFAAKERQGGA